MTLSLGEVAVMESGVAVPEKEAEAVDVDLSSSSPTLFLNRGPQK